MEKQGKPAPILKSSTTHLPVPCSLWHHHLPSPVTQGQRLVPWMWLWLLGSRLGLWEGCKYRELRSRAVSGCPPDPRSGSTVPCQHHESWPVCRRGCTVAISDIHVHHVSNKLCWYAFLSVSSAQYFTHAASMNYKNTACNFKTIQIDSHVYLFCECPTRCNS
jgi:hypothetical protein